MTQLAASSPVMKLTRPKRKKTLSNKAIIWPNELVIQGRNRSTGDMATCLHYQWREKPIGSYDHLVRRKDDVDKRHQAKGRTRPFNCLLTVTINSLEFNFYVDLKARFTNCLTRLRVLLGLLFFVHSSQGFDGCRSHCCVAGKLDADAGKNRIKTVRHGVDRFTRTQLF